MLFIIGAVVANLKVLPKGCCCSPSDSGLPSSIASISSVFLPFHPNPSSSAFHPIPSAFAFTSIPLSLAIFRSIRSSLAFHPIPSSAVFHTFTLPSVFFPMIPSSSSFILEFRRPRRPLANSRPWRLCSEVGSQLFSSQSRRLVDVPFLWQLVDAHPRGLFDVHPESPYFSRFLPQNPVAIPFGHPAESTDPAR